MKEGEKVVPLMGKPPEKPIKKGEKYHKKGIDAGRVRE